ncbi:5-deoxy-glucuronate isomerase [Pantoea sp. Aalb]|uniref:5-deoxy-glucuronate isomerase n=1 Tax=Pantoea sp. Aalb TaxID=2576762 RepID=UPI00132758FC|nr:5-deoxy-glucuronate isomerase [Pantoea sp. Aalb]MXP67853.1 5-deoxy-glucuronate isomerase [Pantoea sp. Aalb]
MFLLYKAQKFNDNGHIQNITPEIIGWDYVGLDVYLLKKDHILKLNSGNKELCLVLISGFASIRTRYAKFPNLGNRLSPFERIPPYAIYVPHNNNIEIYADSDLEIAVCSAPSTGHLLARVITPADICIENRGKGQNRRLVHNILPENQPADSLLVVEVYTNEGATSSYPSHKHDQKDSLNETYLEEIYYHRFNPKMGFAMQRIYTDDRSLDECVAPYDRDVVIVPRGYHPVATVAGYDNYYLNIMAGPKRLWKFTWEKDHVWINGINYPRKN